MQILIVFYSLTGNSRKIAEALAKILNCSTLEIKDIVNRKGVL